MKLVYLSPVPWSSFAQRPHKFVEWFHGATGGEVLWIDPYPTRLPSWSDLRRVGDTSLSASVHSADWLTVIKPKSLPIEPIPGSGAVHRVFWGGIFQAVEQALLAGPMMLGIGKPSELALQLLSMAGITSSFYDAMDDFPAFYGGLSRISMGKREKQLGGYVSKVLVSSTALYARWGKRRDVSLARNACSAQMLPPLEACRQRTERRTLGYVGTLGKWFDWELVYAIARARPWLQVRLIGPVFAAPSSSMPENVELLPPRTHHEAIMAMQDFAVGLIPFKTNRLTDSVDPIKYYEYRALGLPVISSAFGEMRFHCGDPGVFLLDKRADSGALGAVIDAALAYQSTGDEIQEFRANNSWEARFGAVGLL